MSHRILGVLTAAFLTLGSGYIFVRPRQDRPEVFPLDRSDLAGKSFEEMLTACGERAKKDKRNIFIYFSASWCKPCHSLWKDFNQEPWRSVLAENFEILHVHVFESDSTQNTPGAQVWLGESVGQVSIPYYAVVGSDGTLLADSRKKRGSSEMNIGGVHGQSGDHTLRVFRKTATRLTEKDIEDIQNWIEKN